MKCCLREPLLHVVAKTAEMPNMAKALVAMKYLGMSFLGRTQGYLAGEQITS